MKKPIPEESIVVTGIGIHSPLGCGRELSWDRIKKGDSLAREKYSDDLSEELAPYARYSPFINPNGLHRIFPLAHSAVKEALDDSGINLQEIPGERIGCTVSVSKPILNCPAGPSSLWPGIGFRFPEKGPGILPPETVLQYLMRQFKFSGPAQNLIAACATGVHSLLYASRILKEKRCDFAIAGAVESSLHPVIVAGFKQLGVLSRDPCPFDKHRSGFMIGEGAGILALERKTDAVRRGARIYGEIIGCAIGSDYNHPTSFNPDGSSISAVLKRAMDQAKFPVENVDYINLHGTGTEINDIIETKAVKKVFGKSVKGLSLSSTKASTGHLLGASGSLEAAITCLAIRDQFVPPTVNLNHSDPRCDLDYTANKGKSKKINIAASLSFGFGGPIGAILLQREDHAEISG